MIYNGEVRKLEYLVIFMYIIVRIIKDKLFKYFRNFIRLISMLLIIFKICKNIKNNLFFKNIYIVVIIKLLNLINRMFSSKSKIKLLIFNINGIF